MRRSLFRCLPILLFCLAAIAAQGQKKARLQARDWDRPMYAQAGEAALTPIFRFQKKAGKQGWLQRRKNAPRLNLIFDCSSMIRMISFNSGNLEYKSVEAPRLYQFNDLYLNYITGYTIRVGLAYRFDSPKHEQAPPIL